MPELVSCPSCGCKVQVGETTLGRRTRCIACGDVFVAAAAATPWRPPGEPETYPLQPDDEPAPPPRREEWGPSRGPSRLRLPLCPRCHRPVARDADACPHCLHLLDPDDAGGMPRRRRDGDDHRGPLIDVLGSTCLVCGLTGLCTAGLSVVVALATGIPALLMASADLERMRRGELDPAGEDATRTGRAKAIAGLAFAVVCGAIVVWIGVSNYFP